MGTKINVHGFLLCPMCAGQLEARLADREIIRLMLRSVMTATELVKVRREKDEIKVVALESA